MEIVNYEEAVSDFNEKLLTQLRSHGAEADYLEMWVPDEDPAKSILNMVEAAQTYGREGIAIRVSKSTLPEGPLQGLRAEVASIGQMTLDDEGKSWLIRVTGL